MTSIHFVFLHAIAMSALASADMDMDDMVCEKAAKHARKRFQCTSVLIYIPTEYDILFQTNAARPCQPCNRPQASYYGERAETACANHVAAASKVCDMCTLPGLKAGQPIRTF